MIIGKQVVTVFSFSLAKNSVNLSKNYYKILEVDTACDQKLIKKSYLKLVKTLHPDVNPSGKQKFTQVQQAYQVLSDQQLKQYYDKNNYMKASSMNGSQQNKAYSSRAYQTSSGHQYHTHRTYQSDNPHDYFYTDNEFRKKAQNPKQNKDFQQDEEKSNNGFKDNFDYQAKRAKSQASWEEYQRQKQKREEDEFGHETLEQRKMRDKIKAMRGFTSSYNVLWARHHIRHTDLQGNDQRMRKKQQQIRNLMPQKVRKLYDKLMDRIEKIATG